MHNFSGPLCLLAYTGHQYPLCFPIFAFHFKNRMLYIHNNSPANTFSRLCRWRQHVPLKCQQHHPQHAWCNDPRTELTSRFFYQIMDFHQIMDEELSWMMRSKSLWHGTLRQIQVLCFWTISIVLLLFKSTTFQRLDSFSVFR
jgi:hypothetical protein